MEKFLEQLNNRHIPVLDCDGNGADGEGGGFGTDVYGGHGGPFSGGHSDPFGGR